MASATGAGGPEDAFSALVVPELDLLLRVARSIVHNPADAEDLVQETLLRAFRAMSSFDGRHPRAWLLTIMRNAESNRHRRRRPSLLDDPALAEAVVDPRTGDRPEEVVVGNVFEESVCRCLTELPRRFAQVVELVDIVGLSYAEAAAALDVPVGTVMSRLHRGRARIRERLRALGLAPVARGMP